MQPAADGTTGAAMNFAAYMAQDRIKVRDGAAAEEIGIS
jgi:hypothetical protein